MTKIAVFVSGNGSNLQALIDAIDSGKLPAIIKLVVSDCSDCYALTRAVQAKIETFVFNPKSYKHKSEYEKIIATKLKELRVEYLVLAGYMRLIGATLLADYPQKIINIHPSLLPLFPGLDGIGQALAARVEETGVTIHYVDEGMDTGAIIAQERVPVQMGESRASLEKKIHALEHRLYPEVLKLIFTGGIGND